jgi:uncharacterized protein YjbI with pentapeptide repeats
MAQEPAPISAEDLRRTLHAAPHVHGRPQLGSTAFIGVTFSEPADFTRVTFTERIDFTGARFAKGANFSAAVFAQGAYFREATFLDLAVFTRSSFAASQLLFGHVRRDGEVLRS